ncbi:MAG: DUF1640 domain-containing protein [Chloroflexi bacterium]|nr:DUF1640 domain-containing protein [Chloroflexota bacterium]
MAVTFDTRKAVKKLREKGGFSEAGADATVEVVSEATSPLVTRDDLSTALLRERLWVIGSVLAVAGAAVTAVELL